MQTEAQKKLINFFVKEGIAPATEIADKLLTLFPDLQDNKFFLEEFDQSKGVEISKLVWISASIEGNPDLTDILGSIDKNELVKMIPDLAPVKKHLDLRKTTEVIQFLIDKDKFGFLAEVLVPVAKEIRFKNGKPIGWTSSRGHSYVGYIYGETRAELLQKASDMALKFFNEEVAKQKKKKAPAAVKKSAPKKPVTKAIKKKKK